MALIKDFFCILLIKKNWLLFLTGVVVVVVVELTGLIDENGEAVAE
jgi:hypothetical protein